MLSVRLFQMAAFAVSLGFRSIALAQSEPVTQPAEPSAPVPPAAEGNEGPPAAGFQIQGRMGTNLSLASFISPGFSLGYRLNKVVIAAELGVTAAKTTDDVNSSSTAANFITVTPMVSFDVWQSLDGRARLNVMGGAGIGQGNVTSNFLQDLDGDGIPETPTETKTVATIAQLVAGIGGDYYLHKNFALGIEASLNAPILVSVKTDGVALDEGLTANTQALRGIFRITFVTGN